MPDSRISQKVIFWGLGMRHDRAEPARSEAANPWAFAALAYKARGTAVDAFLRRRAPVPLPRGGAPID
jgi:hypothetical protein